MEEEIHLLAGKGNGVSIFGRRWGKSCQLELRWKDFAMIITRENGTKIRFLCSNVHYDKKLTMKTVSFKRIAREIKEGKCELYTRGSRVKSDRRLKTFMEKNSDASCQTSK